GDVAQVAVHPAVHERHVDLRPCHLEVLLHAGHAANSQPDGAAFRPAHAVHDLVELESGCRLILDGHDHVAGLQARRRGRTIGVDLDDGRLRPAQPGADAAVVDVATGPGAVLLV